MRNKWCRIKIHFVLRINFLYFIVKKKDKKKFSQPHKQTYEFFYLSCDRHTKFCLRTVDESTIQHTFVMKKKKKKIKISLGKFTSIRSFNAFLFRHICKIYIKKKKHAAENLSY